MPAFDPIRVTRRAALAALIAAAATGCSRAEFFAVNFPAVFGPYLRHADLAYGEDAQQRLDVYVPDSPGLAARALVVFWHGGRWSFGDKSDYRFVGAALASLGYVAVLANYRHYPEVKMPGFMQDAARAVRWAQAHAGDYGADPEHLYLMGHSAGAHMAVLVALDPRYFTAIASPPAKIAGVIGLSGPYDFLPLREDDVKAMFGPPPLYPDSQPINFAHAGAPPMLLVHGLKDNIVWPRNAINMAAALQIRGVPVTLKLYPQLTHADTVAVLSKPLRSRAPILADIGAFVVKAPSDQAALAARSGGWA
jgi:acetyl esterase/lipase